MDERQSVLREYVFNISKLFKSYSENSKFTTKNLLYKLNLEDVFLNILIVLYVGLFHAKEYKESINNL